TLTSLRTDGSSSARLSTAARGWSGMWLGSVFWFSAMRLPHAGVVSSLRRSQALETSASAGSDRTSAVVLHVECGGSVGGIERNPAGMRAAVLDHVRHRLAECPGDGGLVRRIDACGGVVD